MTQLTALAAVDTDTDPSSAGLADGCLGVRFATGDPAAFEELVTLYQARLIRLVFRLLGWRRDEVQDVVQEVFLAALLHARSFRGDADVGSWLTAIAINKCRSHQRSWRVRWARWRAAAGAETATLALPADAAAMEEETTVRVRQAVQSLRPRDREVIELRYFEQLGLEEIAGVTHRSKNAVEVRLHRARAKLAESLGDWAEEHRR